MLLYTMLIYVLDAYSVTFFAFFFMHLRFFLMDKIFLKITKPISLAHLGKVSL